MRFFTPLIFVFQILIAQDIFQSAEIVIEAFGERLETKTHLTPYLFDIAKNGHLLDSEKKEELKNVCIFKNDRNDRFKNVLFEIIDDESTNEEEIKNMLSNMTGSLLFNKSLNIKCGSNANRMHPITLNL